MTYTVSITPKWQIHIPVAIRQELGLKKPLLADVSVRGNTIMIKPKKSKILQLAGKYQHIKPVKSINLDKIRDYIDYSNW